MLYHNGPEKIRRALSLKAPPAPAVSSAPYGINIPYCVDSGLNEEDCAKILAENGYKPLKSFVPKEGPFKLFVPEGKGGWNYMTFQDGNQQARVVMDCGYLDVQANIPAKDGALGYYHIAFTAQAFCGELSKRGEARHIAPVPFNAQLFGRDKQVGLKVVAVPWEDRFSQVVEELRAACDAASHDTAIPRFAPAIKDPLLPCEAQKENMYRRLPDVCVTL